MYPSGILSGITLTELVADVTNLFPWLGIATGVAPSNLPVASNSTPPICTLVPSLFNPYLYKLTVYLPYFSWILFTIFTVNSLLPLVFAIRT